MFEGPSVEGAVRLLIDGLALSLPLYLLGIFMDRVLKKQSLGGGDIKLLFVTGLYLGAEQNLVMLFVAGILALIYCVIRRKKELPLGPAIALASAMVIILGKIIE